MSIGVSRPGSATGFITPAGQEVLTNKDYDGGTATNLSRLTVPKGTTAALNALTRKEGTLVFDTDTNEVKIDDGATLSALGSAVPASADASTYGTVKTYNPDVTSSVHAVSSADYTVLDNDGYTLILVTTGASDRTVTLPTAADNVGRRIKIAKADSGTGYVLVDAEGAETINGSTSSSDFAVTGQYGFVVVICDGTEWFVESLEDSGTIVLSSSGSQNISGTLYYSRSLGNVTLSWTAALTHDSAADSTTATGVIPAPILASSGATPNIHYLAGNPTLGYRAEVSHVNGTLTLSGFNMTGTGNLATATTVTPAGTIAWVKN